MAMLRSGVDLSVIALWLGHESTETTQMYLHADMQLKEKALAHATSNGIKPPASGPRMPFWLACPLICTSPIESITPLLSRARRSPEQRSPEQGTQLEPDQREGLELLNRPS